MSDVLLPNSSSQELPGNPSNNTGGGTRKLLLAVVALVIVLAVLVVGIAMLGPKPQQERTQIEDPATLDVGPSADPITMLADGGDFTDQPELEPDAGIAPTQAAPVAQEIEQGAITDSASSAIELTPDQEELAALRKANSALIEEKAALSATVSELARKLKEAESENKLQAQRLAQVKNTQKAQVKSESFDLTVVAAYTLAGKQTLSVNDGANTMVVREGETVNGWRFDTRKGDTVTFSKNGQNREVVL